LLDLFRAQVSRAQGDERLRPGDRAPNDWCGDERGRANNSRDNRKRNRASRRENECDERKQNAEKHQPKRKRA